MSKLFNATIKKAGDGKLHDGRGLILNKKGEGGKWIFRYSHLGKRRDMGLGTWPDVSLADARKARDKWAVVLAAGKDPINVRDAEREANRQEQENHDPTFAELVDLVFEARKASLRGDGTRGRWRSPLDRYVIPKIGRKAGSQIKVRDIVDALRPIWKTKFPTAEKAIQRTKIVLRSAKRMGYPTDHDIVDSAQETLGQVHHRVRHTAAVDWRDIPDLYLRLPDTVGGDCNRWIILTLVRMFGARAARLDEVDPKTRIWTVPAERVKGKQGRVEDFRVPLPGPAMEIFKRANETDAPFMFPGMRGTAPITDVAVEKVLRVLEATGTPHGFRTSFRTWVQDTQACSWEVAETVLAHRIGGTVERTYARSDLLEQRRIVMEKWAEFVTGKT